MGSVADIFPPVLSTLPGEMAIGHTRYSTAGDTVLSNAQPFSVTCNRGAVAVAHNGNITNAARLRAQLAARGAIFQATSDTEVVLHLVAQSSQPTFPGALRDALRSSKAPFRLCSWREDRIIVARDPHGFRPLAMGEMEISGGRKAYVFASETCAFDLIGAAYLRDVEPGEMIAVGIEGRHPRTLPPSLASLRSAPSSTSTSRVPILSSSAALWLNRARQLGRLLARECPADADLVVPVPDSGVSAAIGYSAESGLPYRQALIRNHYVGRTFIEPSQAIRDFGVKLKLNPVRYLLEGKRVILVDDSIVRGTTSRKIVRMVRQAGAREVHVRISCPPTISPCYYGVDTPTRGELIAAKQNVEEIRRFVEADSLGYLSLESLRKSVGDRPRRFLLRLLHQRISHRAGPGPGLHPRTQIALSHMPLQIDGNTLALAQVCEVARAQAPPVHLAAAARARMEESRALIDRLAAGDAPIYAVNTGVGLLANVRIPREDLDRLQRNVIRSHSVGVGEPLPREVVRAMMLIRANVLAKGLSGIRPLVAERLCDLLNRGVTPAVPSQGSVGASGDLAPLAHMALVLIGEGEAEFEGAMLPGAEALRRAGIAPIELHPKEGISLINGTQAMLAIGCLEMEAAETLTETAEVAAAMTLDALRGTPRAFDRRIHEARPHPGQLASAARLSALLEGSEIRESHRECARVQDAYSLRCVPQVHGPVRDALAEARRVFEIEINSGTDNPLVFGEEIVSGGNFHGESLAFQLDFLAIALSALAGISERRIDRLVNPALNEELPPFLAGHAGLESGLMMAQVTAASLVAENRVLAHPASTGSITTSGNKEDFVSMGMTSALKLQRIAANTRNVLAIEVLAAARALDLLAPLKSSAPLEAARTRIRSVSPPIGDDRAFHLDIAALASLIASGALATV